MMHYVLLEILFVITQLCYLAGLHKNSCSIEVEAATDKYPGVEQYAIRTSIDSLPMALEENSGLQPMETLSTLKAQQIKPLQRNVMSKSNASKFDVKHPHHHTGALRWVRRR